MFILGYSVSIIACNGARSVLYDCVKLLFRFKKGNVEYLNFVCVYWFLIHSMCILLDFVDMILMLGISLFNVEIEILV